MVAILQGRLPAKPTAEECRDPDVELLWQICCECWITDPAGRPSMQHLAGTLRHMVARTYSLGMNASLWGRRPEGDLDVIFGLQRLGDVHMGQRASRIQFFGHQKRRRAV